MASMAFCTVAMASMAVVIGEGMENMMSCAAVSSVMALDMIGDSCDLS